ncbi:hypothetical protein L6Q21_02755 [Sandaracinobacter sp. RS1-74]|uniref:hypothetical protein n=1 Tax=Sandaracinobacteroides sayramensis TaxID=2913411 RepID=UPI001ED9F7F2|nr:hypothetical protein [Sandaracinobacteroides sayramensis]MCG2839902.1 hypothetical protein [Sandaracinobacteroides sayramensis]
MTRLIPLIGFTLVAGCAATPKAQQVVSAPPPPPPGMELVLDQVPETAIALLGQPRLDKREGTARQMQFSGDCVLDIWYYPQPDMPVPAPLVATHADARLPNGQEAQPGACMQQLIGAREAARAAEAAAAAAKAEAKPAAPKPAQRKRR